MRISDWSSDVCSSDLRGTLEETVLCPTTGVAISTGQAGGTIAKKAAFACGSCGNVQDVLSSMISNNSRAPMAAYAIQGVSPRRKAIGAPYGGRFFAPVDESSQLNAAAVEWAARREDDLSDYWP